MGFVLDLRCVCSRGALTHMHTAEKALASELLRTGWHVLILTANDTSQHHVTRDLLLDNPTVCAFKLFSHCCPPYRTGSHLNCSCGSTAARCPCQKALVGKRFPQCRVWVNQQQMVCVWVRACVSVRHGVRACEYLCVRGCVRLSSATRSCKCMQWTWST